MARVLLVEDEPGTACAYERFLGDAGFAVDLVADGGRALEMLSAPSQTEYDVVVSDIELPGLRGLDLLKHARRFNLSVPFIFTTGYPSWQSAAEGIDLGIVAYLAKPIDCAELVSRVRRASQLYSLSRLQDQARALSCLSDPNNTLLGEYQQATDSLWMAYQPIVSIREQTTYAYEALVRNNSQSLRAPPDLLRAAEQLQQSQTLGRQIRSTIARDMPPPSLSCSPEQPMPLIFVNINPADLLDPSLIQLGGEPLSEQAERVVLEITERDSLPHVSNLANILDNLRAQGYRIAIDDLGQGHAGLNTFVQLDPDFVKLDMSLIRGIDSHHLRRQVVRAMLELCRELKIQVIAEGVETLAEHKTLLSLGAELLQGYLYARPQCGFQTPQFP